MTNYLLCMLLVFICMRRSDAVIVSPETEVLGAATSVVIPANSESVTASNEQSNVTDMVVASDKIPLKQETETPETEVPGSSPTVLTALPITILSEHVTESPETEVPGSSPTIPPTSLTTLAISDTTVKEVGNYSGTVTNRVTVSDTATDLRFGAGDGNSTSSGNVTDNVKTDAPKPARPNPYAIINKGSVSKKQYETCSLVINIILKPVVCVGGVVMNIIGVCVLLQKRFRRSTYTYLCFLAFSDIFLLLCTIIRTIPKYVKFYDDILANSIDVHIFPYENIFLAASFTRISEYIICALAIERFFAVLKPMKVRDLFLCRHALAVCIGISVFCSLIHVHFLFVYYPKSYFNLSRNTTMYALSKHPWYSASGIKPVYDMLYEILFMYAPVLVLITCNTGILVRIHQTNKQRQTIVANDAVNDKMSKEQRKITLTLLIISAFFLMVLTPLTALTIVQKFNKDLKVFGREHYLFYVLIDVLTLGWNINSANDFIVYIYTSKQFKQALAELICRKPVRKLHVAVAKCVAVEVKPFASSSNTTLETVKNANSKDTLSTEESVSSAHHM